MPESQPRSRRLLRKTLSTPARNHCRLKVDYPGAASTVRRPSRSEPYCEDAEKLAAELKFHNLGDSIKGSKAWMSVDWVAWEEKSDIKPVYQMTGKMVAKSGIKNSGANVPQSCSNGSTCWQFGSRGRGC